MFIELIQAETGGVVCINSDNIAAIYTIDDEYKDTNPGSGNCVVEFVGGGSVYVVENPSKILSLIPAGITYY